MVQPRGKLILLVDTNKDTTTGKLCQRLALPDINMVEAVQASHPHLPKTPTFRNGGEYP